MQPRDAIRDALTRSSGEPALVAFVTAGYPDATRFLEVVETVSAACDALEIGVPFTDPMADGVTIQRSSEEALRQGVSLRWIFDELERRTFALRVPILLMSYLNPLLVFGYDALAERAAAVGVSGFMVPDLPLEESGPLAVALKERGLALVQFVTPATPADRVRRLCEASSGFVYAVTRTGITGRQTSMPSEFASYLDSVKSVSSLPVCAGFGVREADQVALVGRHADGVVVGSALVEVLERGEDPVRFLRGLRPPK
jgi:tryptophan synthase alpha chain